MDLKTWLVGMDEPEIQRLLTLLRGGRIEPGCSEAVLQSYGAPVGWAAGLRGLGSRGWTTPLLIEVMTAVLAERQVVRARTAVVCTRPTGPGPEVVDTSVALRRMFQQAEREVLIAGFRITDREMLEPLRRGADRELDVRIFVDLDPSVDELGRRQSARSAGSWPGEWWPLFLANVWPTYMDPPRAFYAPSTLAPGEDGDWRSMHVKSVVVDRRLWFVTSANFTRRGHERNLEMGALIEDRERAEEVVRCFEEWVGMGVFVPVGASS